MTIQKSKARTLRVSVAEEVHERKTIELEIPDDLDISDTAALNNYLEDACCDGAYRQVPLTHQITGTERRYFHPEILP